MKCPLCNGMGVREEIIDPKEKAEVARFLVGQGLSYRDIALVLGWKSANSVTHAVRTNHHPEPNQDISK